MARAKVRIAENYPPFGHNEIERIQKPFSVAQYEQQSWSIAIENVQFTPQKPTFSHLVLSSTLLESMK
jgi:hypothetical protein